MASLNRGHMEYHQESGADAVFKEYSLEHLETPKPLSRASFESPRMNKFSSSRRSKVILLSALAWVFLVHQCIYASFFASHRASWEGSISRMLAHGPRREVGALRSSEDYGGDSEVYLCAPETQEGTDPFQNSILDRMFEMLFEVEAEEARVIQFSVPNTDSSLPSVPLPQGSMPKVELNDQHARRHVAPDVTVPGEAEVLVEPQLQAIDAINRASAFRLLAPSGISSSPPFTELPPRGSQEVGESFTDERQLSPPLHKAHLQRIGTLEAAPLPLLEQSLWTETSNAAATFKFTPALAIETHGLSSQAAVHGGESLEKRELPSGGMPWETKSVEGCKFIKGVSGEADENPTRSGATSTSISEQEYGSSKSNTLSQEYLANIPGIPEGFTREWRIAMQDIGSQCHPGNFALTTHELECRLSKKQLSEAECQYVLELTRDLLLRLPLLTFAETGSISIRRKARSAGVLLRGIAVLYRVTELFKESLKPDIWWGHLFSINNVDALQARGGKVIFAKREYISLFMECINILQQYRTRTPPTTSVLVTVLRAYNNVYRPLRKHT